MKRYDKYKDSGVEWIGKIPENWKVRRLGNLLTDYSEKNNSEFPLLSITREKGVILRDLEEDENHNFIPDDLSGYKKLYLNYFGMNKMKAWQGSYGISKYTGIVSPAYYTFKISDLLYPDFFHLAIRSKTYISFFGSASDGVRIGQWDLSKTRMKNIPFIIPSFPEQQTIASFLDDKTAKIDQTISIKEKEIELLKERRQILIQKAVTKGLDNSVKLKDSGIEWIGGIPEHWGLKKLKYLTKCLNTKRIPLETTIRGSMEQKKYPYYGATGIIDYVEDYIFDEETILIAEDGANLIFRNLQLIYKPQGKYWVNNHSHILRPLNHINRNYLAFLMECFDYTIYISGAAQPKLTKENLLNILFFSPPLVEQNRIVTYLEKIEEKISKAISLKQQEIEKLKEYKTVLIDNVVTGKISVC